MCSSDLVGTATLSVSRLGSTSGTASVNYATVSETGAGKATAGVDYTATSGTLNFAAGDVQKTFTIVILPDTLVEGNETVLVQLSNPQGAVFNTALLPSSATLTIVDDDFSAGTINYSAAVYTVSENVGTVPVTVTRAGGNSGVIQILAQTVAQVRTPASLDVTNRVLATNSATLTTAGSHGFLAGDAVVVQGVGTTFDGT